jgi:hypothetical protein
MKSTRKTTDRCRSVSLQALLAATVLFAPFLATKAAAQSDAGTVNASVTVASDAITVTGAQDLLFGTHFAVEGLIVPEQAAAWQIDVSNDPTNVDLTLTVLPSELLGDPTLPGVPLIYGIDSFAAQCAGIVITADPFIGITNCDVSPGFGAAVLGDDPLIGLGTEPITADVSAAAPGVYTATVELTATIN